MLYEFPFSDLGLRDLDVMKQLGMLNKIFICLNVQEHGGAPPMLCQNQRPTGFFHLVYERSGVGSEFRKGSDIFGGRTFGMASSCGIRYVVQHIVPNLGRVMQM